VCPSIEGGTWGNQEGGGNVCPEESLGHFGFTMSSLLFGVTPLDARTYLVVAIVLLVAAMVASYVPAHRAALADPAETLRRE